MTPFDQRGVAVGLGAKAGRRLRFVLTVRGRGLGVTRLQRTADVQALVCVPFARLGQAGVQAGAVFVGLNLRLTLTRRILQAAAGPRDGFLKRLQALVESPAACEVVP